MTGSTTKKWICVVCGYECEGETPPEVCPVCGAGPEDFEAMAAPDDRAESCTSSAEPPLEEYLSAWAKKSDPVEAKFERMSQLAKTGKSEISAMRTQKPFPDWDTILFKGAQLARMPLNEDEPVRTTTVIGKTAKQPLEIALPFYVSHMSFGALSREAKIALARGSHSMGTAICSGEGGMLPEERAEAKFYIYELGTASFSHVDASIQQADAVEIKIGQAAKPGLGGHLPKEKITPEIAKIRGLVPGQDSISPSRPFNISCQEDLIKQMQRLKDLTGGKPVGIKITAGHLREDLAFALAAQPDFITIDCRGGATGAAPTFVKDNVCMPPIFALRHARHYLNSIGSPVTLCITGGFRDSADIAKALALGADAVALATASLIAIGCQQYRVCNTGKCPVGITTQDPELRSRLQIERSVQRFVNFYQATAEEIKTFARINGRANVHDLDMSDVFTISNEVSQNTDILHV